MSMVRMSPIRQLRLIKGGGAALTREKIIAAASRRFICIADDSKLVDVLGRFPLPVEVIPMARSYVARQLVALGGHPIYREGVVTDNGNQIIDVHRSEDCRSGRPGTDHQSDCRGGYGRVVCTPARGRSDPRHRVRHSSTAIGSISCAAVHCVVRGPTPVRDRSVRYRPATDQHPLPTHREHPLTSRYPLPR